MDDLKLDFTLSITPNPTSGTIDFHSVNKNFDFTIRIPENVKFQSGLPFQAQPRPLPAKQITHYCWDACKIIFFPITILNLIVQHIFYRIAFHFGVGATREIDEGKREQLKRLGGKEITFFTEDKAELEGMLFRNSRASNPAKTVLICSGSHASYEEYTVPMVDALLKLGHHVMVFNYRGFGKSQGSSSEEGFYLDVEAAYQYLKFVEKIPDEQLAVLGYSLGSGPAADLAAHHKIKLILDRYFSSMKNVARDRGGWIAKWIFYLGGADFDVKKKIRDVEGDVLLARGRYDNNLPIHHQQELQPVLSGNSRVTMLEVDSSHFHTSNYNLWFHPENPFNASYRQQFQEFLGSLCL